MLPRICVSAKYCREVIQLAQLEHQQYGKIDVLTVSLWTQGSMHGQAPRGSTTALEQVRAIHAVFRAQEYETVLAIVPVCASALCRQGLADQL